MSDSHDRLSVIDRLIWSACRDRLGTFTAAKLEDEQLGFTFTELRESLRRLAGSRMVYRSKERLDGYTMEKRLRRTSQSSSLPAERRLATFPRLKGIVEDDLNA